MTYTFRTFKFFHPLVPKFIANYSYGIIYSRFTPYIATYELKSIVLMEHGVTSIMQNCSRFKQCLGMVSLQRFLDFFINSFTPSIPWVSSEQAIPVNALTSTDGSANTKRVRINLQFLGKSGTKLIHFSRVR